MNKLLQLLLSNKHTSFAGLAYFCVEPAAEIAAVWFPTHAAQIQQTSKYIKGAAAAYGLMAAGDATKSATKEEVKTVSDAVRTGDTSTLTKAQAPDPPKP